MADNVYRKSHIFDELKCNQTYLSVELPHNCTLKQQIIQELWNFYDWHDIHDSNLIAFYFRVLGVLKAPKCKIWLTKLP